MSLRALPACLLVALALPAAAGGRGGVPETTITSGPPALVTTVAATFAFASDEQPARFACAIDSGAFFDCSSPYSLTVGDGRHNFYVVAVKNDKTDPSPAVWTWTVDTTPPPPVNDRVDVRYRRLALSWGTPATFGADLVVVLRSTSPKKQPTREVYRGSGSRYVDTNFENGVYHRYRIVATDKAGNVGAPVDVQVAPGALLLAPKEGATLHSPTTLRWRAAPKATFYNVQLWRGGKKVLSTWPRGTQVKMSRSWTYLGHRYRLTPGKYTWYVWPGFGPLAQGRYGGLLGQGTFRIV